MQYRSIVWKTHGMDTVHNFHCHSAGKEEKYIAPMQHNWGEKKSCNGL